MAFRRLKNNFIVPLSVILLFYLVGCSRVLIKLDDQMGAVNNGCKIHVIDKRPTDKIVFQKYLLEQTPSLPVILKSRICNLPKMIKHNEQGAQIILTIDNTTGKDIIGFDVILIMEISGTIKINNSTQDVRTFTSIEGTFIGPKDLMKRSIDDFVSKVDEKL